MTRVARSAVGRRPSSASAGTAGVRSGRRAGGRQPPPTRRRPPRLGRPEADRAAARPGRGAHRAGRIRWGAESVLDEAGELAAGSTTSGSGARTLVADARRAVRGPVSAQRRRTKPSRGHGRERSRRSIEPGTPAGTRRGVAPADAAPRNRRAIRARCRRGPARGRLRGARRGYAARGKGAVGYATSVLLGPTSVSEAIPRCEALAIDVSGDRKAEAVVLRMLAPARRHGGPRSTRPASCYTQAGELIADLGPSMTGAVELARVVPGRDARRRVRGRGRALPPARLHAIGGRWRALLPIEHRGVPGPGALGAGEVRGGETSSPTSPRSWRTPMTSGARSCGGRSAPSCSRARPGRRSDRPGRRRRWTLAAKTSNIEQHADALRRP